MTWEQIKEILEENNVSVSDFGYGEFGEYEKYKNGKINYEERILPGVGRWVEVEQHGGEDEGSDWYSVKHFLDHDIYVKTQGYYSSYHGTDFEDGYGEQVYPRERTVIVYEK